MESVIKSPAFSDEIVSLELGFSENHAFPTIEVKTSTHISDTDANRDILQQALLEEQAEQEILHELIEKSDLTPTFEHFWEMHREKLEILERNAANDGYKKGYAKGESDAQLKYAEAVNQFQQLTDVGQASIALMLKDAETLIGSIVFEAVCKIVGEQMVRVDGCHQIILQVIKNTLDDDILAIKVSPSDFTLLQLSRKVTDTESASVTDKLTNLPIEADPDIELGGCLVELKDGRIDGRIETQFRIFAQSIKDAISHR